MALTQYDLYDRFFNGGNYALPYLLKFSCGDIEPIYLVNNNEAISYDGNTYEASSFNYTAPDSMGSGATLTISANDNTLIEFIENADENFRLDVVGIIAENGDIQKLKQYVHFYGSVDYSENMELSFKLESDDRMGMAFPPYKFDTDTNKGNS